MTGTVIVRLKGIKDEGNLTHDLGERNGLNYVDHTKSHLNMIVIGQPFAESKQKFKEQKKFIVNDFNQEKAQQRQFIMPDFLDEKEYVKERRKVRNWQSHMKSHLAGFIGFGHDAQANSLDREKMDACAKEYVKTLCDRHGIELLYLIRHEDETTPHYHFLTTNYNPATKHTIRLDRNLLRKEQDKIGESFSSMGLTRGLDKQERLKLAAEKLNQPMIDGRYSAEVWKESNVIHRSVKQLHEDLPLEIEDKKEEIQQIQAQISKQQAKIEKNQKLIAKNEHTLLQLAIKEASSQVKQEKIEKRLKIYQKRINDAQAEIDRLSVEFAPPKTSIIEYVSGYEKPLIGPPKPTIKKTKVVSVKNANASYKAAEAYKRKLEQQEFELKNQKAKAKQEQLVIEEELKAFFAKLAYKHMMVFGKPFDSQDEMLDFIKWFDQDTGWVTTNIGTRFKTQTENNQVVRVVVEHSEGISAKQKAKTLLFATHKAEMTKGHFKGLDEVLIEFCKMMKQSPGKYDFELILSDEQKTTLTKNGIFEEDNLQELVLPGMGL
ncbi:hypothetical protein [Thiomicrorhabdus lithotrophica]|uniref:Plasmid recombination enzyme n=1 Tax=Thiomicrorhabdus lithotrophica TaxID=2949997 RepID=A0ABY8C7D9_9GAMM|nr:hypothetical protein [Thiomicrorhabdus lithotrophica]WEJ61881.1 hypothetical protein NR989_07620 [Thiomicrorhabdus lithotrophica]